MPGPRVAFCAGIVSGTTRAWQGVTFVWCALRWNFHSFQGLSPLALAPRISRALLWEWPVAHIASQRAFGGIKR
jgi:hypothetical protein